MLYVRVVTFHRIRDTSRSKDLFKAIPSIARNETGMLPGFSAVTRQPRTPLSGGPDHS